MMIEAVSMSIQLFIPPIAAIFQVLHIILCLVSMLGPRLSDGTICMVAESKDEGYSYRQYDIHSLYGWSQTPPTLQWV